MIWLIYSDVHGNLPAFEAVIEDCGYYDASVSLGDLVNYGPWSNECVDLAQSLKNNVLIRGNHEDSFIAGKYPGNNELVKLFFDQTFTDFARHKEIQAYVDDYHLDNFTLCHTIDNKYIFPDTKIELNEDLIIGHSHHQFEHSSNGHKLFNTGSVGQNRKIINMANYLIYDQVKGVVTLKSVIYDVEKLIREMKARRYSNECVEYYLKKDRA